MKRNSNLTATYLVLTLFIMGAVGQRVHADLPVYVHNLSATAVSQTKIDLAWTGVVANPAVTGYKIEREISIGGGFTTIVLNTGSTAAGYADPNLAPNTVYNYRVYGSNGEGTGLPSDPAAASTLAIPPPPQTPQSLTATAVTGLKAYLTWTAPYSSSPIVGYRIEREVLVGGFFLLVPSTSSTVTNYTDPDLVSSLTYNYRVSAINTYGTIGSPSLPAGVVMPTLPTGPQSASASAGDGQATVSWTPPFFAGGGVTGYLITGAPGGSATASGTARSATLTGLTNGTAYTFSVKAVNQAGQGPVATTASVTPQVGLNLPAQAATTTPSGVASTTTASSTAATTPSASLATTTAKTFYFGSNFQKGARGQAVQELQKRLQKAGFFAGSVTDYFGAVTEAAVKAYQRSRRITPTGFIGPLTRVYLNAGL